MELKEYILPIICDYLNENITKTIRDKAMELNLDPRLESEYMLVVIDVKKFLDANWYGDKPNKNFIPTRLPYGNEFTDKYSRAKDFIKKTDGHDIYAPHVTAFTKNGSIYGLEGTHRFMVFFKSNVKKMVIAVPKNTDINRHEWILNVKI